MSESREALTELWIYQVEKDITSSATYQLRPFYSLAYLIIGGLSYNGDFGLSLFKAMCFLAILYAVIYYGRPLLRYYDKIKTLKKAKAEEIDCIECHKKLSRRIMILLVAELIIFLISTLGFAFAGRGIVALVSHLF